jgi:hypothetical protein
MGTNGGPKLRHRGLLTESIAKGLLALHASTPDATLKSVMVSLFDQRGSFIVELPLAEAIHATAFDVCRNERASWGHAASAEVFILT